MSQRDVLFDYCACGRRKEKAEYVCPRCYHGPPIREFDEPLLKRGKWVKIVCCPRNEYPKGDYLPAVEFNMIGKMGATHATTLDLGYWVEGMIIEDWDGKRWRVCGEQEKPQWIEREQ